MNVSNRTVLKLLQHPSSDTLHHPPEGKDEGSQPIPRRGEERLTPLSFIKDPPRNETDDGCRIISSSDLLVRSQKQLAASPQVELWNLHVRAGAVTLFIGETSVGKTVFLHNLAYHLASGQDFLGIVPPRPLRVLYIDFESYTDIFAEHLSAIGTADGWDFVELDGLEPGPALIDRLAALSASAKYDVIIIDPLMEAYPVKDENDNALANTQMQAFRDLARSTNAGVIVVHNSGLRGKDKSGSPKFLGRGATSRVDRADISINFTSTGSTARRLHVAKARGKNLNEEILFRFAGDLGYQLVQSSVLDSTLVDTLGKEIVVLIERETAEGRREVERKTILDRLNAAEEKAREQAIDRALAKSLAAGALVKVRKGVYRLSLESQTSGSADETDNAGKGCLSETAELSETTK